MATNKRDHNKQAHRQGAVDEPGGRPGEPERSRGPCNAVAGSPGQGQHHRRRRRRRHPPHSGPPRHCQTSSKAFPAQSCPDRSIQYERVRADQHKQRRRRAGAAGGRADERGRAPGDQAKQSAPLGLGRLRFAVSDQQEEARADLELRTGRLTRRISPCTSLRPLKLRCPITLLHHHCRHHTTRYLSLYFLHYTDACEKEFGRLMSASAVVGMLANLVTSSLSDRYRAHRLVYTITLALAYVSMLALFVPILFFGELAEPRLSDDGEPAANDDDDDEDCSTKTLRIYLVSLCLALGSLAITINMNFSESFTTNMAKRCAGSESYGSLRFYGALGWFLVALVLILAEKWASRLPHLLLAWTLFACLAGLNLLLVLAWPASSARGPFDLAAGGELDGGAATGANGGDWHGRESLELGQLKRPNGQQHRQLAISFGRRYCCASGPVAKLTRQSATPAEPIGVSIQARRHSLESLDGRNNGGGGSARPELRRCSIAALGSSHVVEQFRLSLPAASRQAGGSGGGDPLKRWPNQEDIHTRLAEGDTGQQLHHFKYITKIQPVSAGAGLHASASAAELMMMFASEWANGVHAPAPAPAPAADQRRPSAKRPPVAHALGFRLHLKIIELIARRNKNMLRFMVLYAIVGFLVAMNWYFLFPYLELLDARKIKTIAPAVMMSGYLSETLFYYVAPKLPIRTRPSVALSLVLFAFAARYFAYLTFNWWSVHVWPLELIVLVELLQALTIGWFDCILNESALEFALEAEHSLPELIRLNLVDGSAESAAMVRDGVKMSMVSVSSCFYDGLGVATGSLVGGWLIDRHNYSCLWTTSAGVGLLVGGANLLLEWTGALGGDRPPTTPADRGQGGKTGQSIGGGDGAAA
jgi:hypothetical protein